MSSDTEGWVILLLWIVTFNLYNVSEKLCSWGSDSFILCPSFSGGWWNKMNYCNSRAVHAPLSQLRKDNWPHLWPLAEPAYNKSMNSIGKSPFQAAYGLSPTTPYILQTSNFPQDLQATQILLKKQLDLAKCAHKHAQTYWIILPIAREIMSDFPTKLSPSSYVFKELDSRSIGPAEISPKPFCWIFRKPQQYFIVLLKVFL